MKINILQRISISVCSVLVIICIVFPPYYGTDIVPGDNPRPSIGYLFIFNSPSPSYVKTSFDNFETDPTIFSNSQEVFGFYSDIRYRQLYIQLIGLSLLAVGLVLTFKD